ncbi:MAG: peptidylprolyl isomerase [Halothiobacillaceae bacterium]
MNISKDKVVYIHFTLRDEAGEVLHSNVGGDPIPYLHGHGNLIPGLERALEGRASGERIEVTIPPAEAYGERDPAGIIKVPRSTLSPEVVVEIGNHVQTMGPEGRIEFTIIGFDDEMVILDGNHPLAGRTLYFEVEVGAIRDAHPDEVKHHRVHPAGHHLMVMDSSFDESLLKQVD